LDLPFDDHSEMIERPRFLGFRLIGGFAAARYGARGGFDSSTGNVKFCSRQNSIRQPTKVAHGHA